MKFINAINTQDKPFLSMEIIPPKKGSKLDKIFNVIDILEPFKPKFISVTKHQTIFDFVENNQGIIKIPKHKQAGPVGLAGAIKQRYNIEPIPHLICGGNDKFKIEDLLIDLQYLEIENIFVIRGDANAGKKFVAETDGFLYASEMVEQISNMNKGKYTFPAKDLEPSNFCVGVAGYPEKHYEAMNMATDLINLKKKINTGADYIITQMFFDFDLYKDFVEKVRNIGIDVPIIPGIKPIIRNKFLRIIPRAFFVDVPKKMVKLFDSARTKQEEMKIGTSYMTQLVEKLLDYGVPAIHVFTMGQGKSTKALLQNFSGYFK